MKYNKNIIYISIVLLVTLILAYANHFNNGFYLDDYPTIVDNVYVRSLKNIPDFFHDPNMFSARSDHKGIRPLVSTSLAIDYWLAGGLNPWMFHLSTFLWHISLCTMLFFLYKNLISKSTVKQWTPYIALIGAGWFAVHAAIAETINYITARSDVQSTFFIVASFLVYISFPERRKYYIYVLLAVMGVFAKETVPTLPILLFFYVILFEKKISLFDLFSKKGIAMAGKTVSSLIPLIIAVACVQLYVLSKIDAHSLSKNTHESISHYLLTQSYVWFHYFRSFFLPYGMTIDHNMELIRNIYDDRLLFGVLFVFTLFFTIFKTSKHPTTRPISFGLLWFSTSLLPTSLMPLAEVMNDHRMYFAFIGLTLSIVTALGLAVINKQAFFEKKNNLKILIASICLIISLNAYGVIKRNQVWGSEKATWLDVMAKSPNNPYASFYYGLQIMAEGDIHGAIEYFKKAEQIAPFFHQTLYVNFGIAYASIGDEERAVKSYEKAISLYPNNENSYTYYARFCLKLGNFSKAKDLAEKAMALNDGSYLARELTMQAYQAMEKWEELEILAVSTLQYFPNDQKALTYLESAKNKEVIPVTTSVSELINRSLQQYNQENYKACIATCERALKIDPKNINAYNNICAAYNMLREWEKAIAACEKALEIDPDYSRAKANLKWAVDESNKQ